MTLLVDPTWFLGRCSPAALQYTPGCLVSLSLPSETFRTLGRQVKRARLAWRYVIQVTYQWTFFVRSSTTQPAPFD